MQHDVHPTGSSFFLVTCIIHGARMHLFILINDHEIYRILQRLIDEILSSLSNSIAFKIHNLSLQGN